MAKDFCLTNLPFSSTNHTAIRTKISLLPFVSRFLCNLVFILFKVVAICAKVKQNKEDFCIKNKKKISSFRRNNCGINPTGLVISCLIKKKCEQKKLVVESN
jgi:hypothetical protein